jgi:hypothetical protein
MSESLQPLEQLQQLNGWDYVRQLPDGRLLGVMAMTYGKGRLWVGDAWSIHNSY